MINFNQLYEMTKDGFLKYKESKAQFNRDKAIKKRQSGYD